MYTELMEEADIPAGPRPGPPGDDQTRSGGPGGGALTEDGGRLAGETVRRQSRGYFTSSTPCIPASWCPSRVQANTNRPFLWGRNSTRAVPPGSRRMTSSPAVSVLIGTLRDTNSPGDLPVALPIGAFLGDPWIIRCWLDVPLRVNGP